MAWKGGGALSLSRIEAITAASIPVMGCRRQVFFSAGWRGWPAYFLTPTAIALRAPILL